VETTQHANPTPIYVPEVEEHSQEHDHGADHGHAATFIERLTRFLGKFHPLVVHFPIALLLGAVLAELISWVGRYEKFDIVGRFCLWLGVFGAVAAAPLGWLAAMHANYPQLERILEWHRWSGTSVATLAILTLIVSEVSHRKKRKILKMLYRGLLLLVAILVGMSSHFGATLIYGPDYFRF